MRIDLVSEHASPLAAVGGAEAGGQNVHVAALAKALAARGSQVRVHTRRTDPALPDVVPMAPGVEVVHLDAGPPGPLARDAIWPHIDELADGLARATSLDPPDVVHAHFWMSGVAACLARRRTGIPVAITFHALGVEKRRHQAAKDTSPSERIAIECRLAADADLILATTAAEACEHVAAGVAPERVVVVPCGVDLARFRGPIAERPSRRSPAQIVSVSRLVERKGIANLIEALAFVPDAELVIAGGPARADLRADPAVAHYRDLAAEHGVGDRVRLIGALDHDAVPELLRCADLVVCCPWYEPFGMVAVEAMACGVPVVASAVGGLAETVVDGRTGRLVPPRDPLALALALRELIGDPERRQAM